MSEYLCFWNDFCITLKCIHYKSDRIRNLFRVTAITNYNIGITTDIITVKTIY